MVPIERVGEPLEFPLRERGVSAGRADASIANRREAARAAKSRSTSAPLAGHLPVLAALGR